MEIASIEQKKKTVYLAGMITDDPCYRMKFYNAAHELGEDGFAVVNPALLPPTGFEYEAYMRITTAMLDECDAACFLPDWRYSRGAQFEYGRAVALGKETFYYEDWKTARDALSNEQTNKLAFRCFDCGKISIYDASSGDGRSCVHCDGRIAPLGYAKEAVEADA